MTRSIFLAAAVACMTAFSSPTIAAPQMLGVVATVEPLPMTCENGQCVAHLTAFCLQKRRAGPDDGTPYVPYDGGFFEVALTDDAGNTRVLDATEAGLEIETKRGFTAVTARLDAGTLDAHGAASASISVIEGATLLPVPVEGDPKPLTEQEIAHVTGHLRDLARQWLSGAHEKTAALQTVNTIINLSPEQGFDDYTQRYTVWERATDGQLASMPAAAVNRAKEIYDACDWRVQAGRYHTLRRCLEVKHDSLLLDLNTSYWKGVGAGS